MAAASAPSCYSRLDPTSRTIRVLLLSACLNANDGRIQCSLIETPLDRARPYEALSYRWGVPDYLDLKIHLNGTLVTVRRNLWVALHYLQNCILSDRALWVDALCIHQEDEKERNHQVSFMGEIYKQAEVVLAWLGEPSDPACDNKVLSNYEVDDSAIRNKLPRLAFETDTMDEAQLAFDMLRAGTAAAAALNIEVGRNEPIDCLDRWFIEFGQSLEVTHLWRLVLEICNSKYWNRLWIIQEIGLAKRVTVFYGRAFCDWVDLSVPISILTYWRETFSQRFDNTAGKSLGFWFKGSAVAKFLEKKGLRNKRLPTARTNDKL